MCRDYLSDNLRCLEELERLVAKGDREAALVKIRAKIGILRVLLQSVR